MTGEQAERRAEALSTLRELLDEQEALFTRLDALSKRQRALVEGEQTDELLRLLGERQRVVEGIEAASRALRPYRERWEDVLAEAKPDQRDRFSGQVERLSELAARVAARDDADRRLMEERRDRLAADLAGAGRGRGAVSAYGPPAGRPAPKFQDREA